MIISIDKAIKDNETLAVELDASGQDRLAKAVRLGIEALKEVARARFLGPPLKDWRLPGETQE